VVAVSNAGRKDADVPLKAGATVHGVVIDELIGCAYR